MSANYEHVCKLDRIAVAAKTLREVDANMPGDDLGQQARARCIMEMDAALAELDWSGFSWKASLEYYEAQHP